jgi:hypothetical protein
MQRKYDFLIWKPLKWNFNERFLMEDFLMDQDFLMEDFLMEISFSLLPLFFQ